MIKENQKLLNIFQFIIDGIIIALSFVLAYRIRFNTEWRDFFNGIFKPIFGRDLIAQPIGYYLPEKEYVEMLVFLIPAFLILYNICKLYDPKRTNSRRSELWGLIKANFLGIIYCAAALFLLKQSVYARLFLGIFAVSNVLLDFLFRSIVSLILKRMRRSGRNLKHIILVGYSRSAIDYIDRLRSHPEWGYYVHGILDDTQPTTKKYRNVPVIGKISLLPRLLSTNKFDEIGITIGIDEFGKLEKIVETCEKSGVYTKFIPDYNQILPTKPYTEDLDGVPVIHIRHVPLTSSLNKFIKRTIDIAGSLFGIIILAIPMSVVMIIIKATSKGPIFFSQNRIGTHNKEFKMYKFRSMVIQEETEEKKAWTTKDDPRVTKIGKFMRKTNIDELPQLFNVLKGDMSLVGPRPERPFFVNKFQQEIPRYMVKHQVRPGMTGWAQVNGLRGDTSISKRIQYDLYYVENWTLALDIKILFLTFFSKKVNENAY
ncbi:MAG: undecaprenyl-phosphate glucose phosphotransferase [Lachnospiraceae bacterium]|nr:undecaprenyl-phosphate glucose phosphotransferase [Lachnospiraceae bacterium]